MFLKMYRVYFWIVVLKIFLQVDFVNLSSSMDYTERHNKGYMLLTPRQLISGATNRLCVSRFGAATEGKASAMLEILPPMDHHRSTRKTIARARKTFLAGNGGCLDVLVPRTPHTRLILHLRMRFEALPNYKVNSQVGVLVQHSSNVIIVMNKPVYRQTENVRFRILQLKPDLTPLQMPIYRVSIEAPAAMFGGPVKVVQWTNVTTQLGVTQKEYQLDKYAQKGEWRIVVDSRDPAVASTWQTFMVRDYTLPSLYLTVDHPNTILITFKQLVYRICANYMHGEGVNGILDITVSSDSYDSEQVHQQVELKKSQGCFNHTVRTSRLGFHSKTSHRPKVIVANVAFKEDGTKQWTNTTATSHVAMKVVTVQFVTKNFEYFKPELPQQVRISVTNWENKAVAGAKVQFCQVLGGSGDRAAEEVDNLEETDDEEEAAGRPGTVETCETGATDDKGHASFVFTVETQEPLQLKASVLDHPLKEFEESPAKLFAMARLSVRAWGGTGGSGVHMDVLVPSGSLRPGARHVLPVFLTLLPQRYGAPITLHHAIITRSGVIYRWGTSVQCPEPIYDVQSLISVWGGGLGGSGGAHNAGEGSCPPSAVSSPGAYKLSLAIRISHQMCPTSHIIVYYRAPDGELIVAKKQFRVDECFLNKVKQQWIPSTVSPSSSARLRLQSVGPALCLLGATSRALRHVAPRATSVRSSILNQLNDFVESRFNNTQNEMEKDVCFETQTSENLQDSSIETIKCTVQLFLSSGLDIVSDIIPTRTKCPIPADITSTQPTPAEISIKKPVERSYFPETFMWDIQIMGPNGTLEFETRVPEEVTFWDTQVYCVSRSGVATPTDEQNTALRVFQPFFIELATPRKMKRGENIQMYYKIHNYMKENLPVEVELEVTPLAAATLTSHQTRGQLCVQGHAPVTSHFTLKAHQLTTISVSVTAHVQNNMQHACNEFYPTNVDGDKISKEIIIDPEGTVAENFKSAFLCIPKDSNSTKLSWEFGKVACVEHSENWFINMVGDVAGPMLMKLDGLISRPMGCGEQNMMLLAHNLLAMEYSVHNKRSTSSSVREQAMHHLQAGYQRQLRFLHPDTGAFSAFGPSDGTPSTWLTAFCLKYLHRLHSLQTLLLDGKETILDSSETILGDERILQRAGEWLVKQQMENGCFMNVGQVFHREMKGGLRSDTSSIALTAYVVISLIDSGTSKLYPSVIKNAAYCLAALKYGRTVMSANSRKPEDTTYMKDSEKMYAFTLATLAQLKIEKLNSEVYDQNDVFSRRQRLAKRYIDSRHLELPEGTAHGPRLVENGYLAGGGTNALTILINMANTRGDLTWWEAGSLSVSLESTAYSMLSLLAVGGDRNLLTAMSAARWLSAHRSSIASFTSTQDTLIGLEALSLLRQSLPTSAPSLGVLVRGPGRLQRRLSVSPSERHRLHSVVFRGVDIAATHKPRLHLAVEGKGCMLIQATQRYNTLVPEEKDSPFKLFTKLTTDGTFACKEDDQWCRCAAILEVCVVWSSPSREDFPEMALLEIEMPTGYSPDRSLLYKLINNDNLLLRRIEESAFSESIFMYLSVKSVSVVEAPSACVQLHLVGPQGDTSPASVHIHDYYHPHISQTTTYSIPADCPYDADRRPHTEPSLFLPLGETIADHAEPLMFPPSLPTNPTWTPGDQDGLMWETGDPELRKEWSGSTDGALEANQDVTDDLTVAESLTETYDSSGFIEENPWSLNPHNSSPEPVDPHQPWSSLGWHVLEQEEDLETPTGDEGVSPVYLTPSANFKPGNSTGEQFPQDDLPLSDSSQLMQFQNWSIVESETDLKFPDGLEANRPVWVKPEPSRGKRVKPPANEDTWVRPEQPNKDTRVKTQTVRSNTKSDSSYFTGSSLERADAWSAWQPTQNGRHIDLNSQRNITRRLNERG